MQLIGLGNLVTKILVAMITYTYKAFKFLLTYISKGLGKVIEISFEYLIKLFYQIYRFIRR
jgi:hypothetical protein